MNTRPLSCPNLEVRIGGINVQRYGGNYPMHCMDSVTKPRRLPGCLATYADGLLRILLLDLLTLCRDQAEELFSANIYYVDLQNYVNLAVDTIVDSIFYVR